MHEAKFSEQIVENILGQLNNSEVKPKRVKVCVGEVFHLEKDSVLFHYDLVTKGTRLEGVVLELEEEPIQIECQKCKAVGGVEDHHLLMCSHCGSLGVKVLRGQSIYTQFIEVE